MPKGEYSRPSDKQLKKMAAMGYGANRTASMISMSREQRRMTNDQMERGAMTARERREWEERLLRLYGEPEKPEKPKLPGTNPQGLRRRDRA